MNTQKIIDLIRNRRKDGISETKLMILLILQENKVEMSRKMLLAAMMEDMSNINAALRELCNDFLIIKDKRREVVTPDGQYQADFFHITREGKMKLLLILK